MALSLTTKMLHKKIKQEHTIMDEFHPFLEEIARIPEIQRIIPGRIHRKQSWSSTLRITYSYLTITWLKYKLSKGSTSQELFVVGEKSNWEEIIGKIEAVIRNHVW